MKHLRIIILLSVSLLLTSCEQQSPDESKFKPVVNPNPHYFMTVQGRVDPALMGKIKVGIDATYSTRNKVCDKLYYPAEGIHGWRKRTIFFAPKHYSEDGHYQFKIPLDYYQAGFCKWRIFWLSDYSGLDGASTLAVFSPCGGDSINCRDNPIFKIGKYATSAKFNVSCSISPKRMVICNKITGKDFGGTVLYGKNYQFTENFILEKWRGHESNN